MLLFHKRLRVFSRFPARTKYTVPFWNGCPAAIQAFRLDFTVFRDWQGGCDFRPGKPRSMRSAMRFSCAVIPGNPVFDGRRIGGQNGRSAQSPHRTDAKAARLRNRYRRQAQTAMSCTGCRDCQAPPECLEQQRYAAALRPGRAVLPGQSTGGLPVVQQQTQSSC